ncbi:MAG: SDR family NAD(P)-dependent oxidoreductase [Sphingomonadales bacterium]
MSSIRGKIAIVTGAGSEMGIGQASASRLAAEGAIVILTDIDGESAKARAAEIQSKGGTASGYVHDVIRADAWDTLFDTVIGQHGCVDILVNNAGIVVIHTIDEMTEADFVHQMNVNVTGVFLGTKRAVAEMRRTGGGSIINMSSVAGQVGVPGVSAYCASKGAIRLFTKSIALETAKEKIRVNSIHPGAIWTNIQKKALGDDAAQIEALAASIPMGWIGEPADVANCVLFLASDESRYITGAELTVDGGMTAT